jgi:hypothetical protein
VGFWLWARAAEAQRQAEAEKRAAEEARQVKVAYYANVSKRWGVMQGVGKVTAEQAKHRQVTYKFYSRAGRVEKVQAINGNGILTAEHGVTAYLEVRVSRKEKVLTFRVPSGPPGYELRLETRKAAKGS